MRFIISYISINLTAFLYSIINHNTFAALYSIFLLLAYLGLHFYRNIYKKNTLIGMHKTKHHTWITDLIKIHLFAAQHNKIVTTIFLTKADEIFSGIYVGNMPIQYEIITLLIMSSHKNIILYINLQGSITHIAFSEIITIKDLVEGDNLCISIKPATHLFSAYNYKNFVDDITPQKTVHLVQNYIYHFLPKGKETF